jgi:heme-degrading monooxygenase HmoA
MELITGPPPESATSAIAAIDGVSVVPTALNVQLGPERRLGPESAGAILVLQGTYVDRSKFEEFWHEVAQLTALLATAPGFIRRYTFADGPHYTLIAWWRSLDDAHAFFSSPEHQTAMRRTLERRWGYTHFTGLWQLASPRQRLIFCQSCDGVASAIDPTCPGCGSHLDDPIGDLDVPAAADVSR